MFRTLHKKKSYSLWLRPSQTQINTVMETISELSHRFNSTPFPPHITLLSSIFTKTYSIEAVCELIIEQHSAFNITLGKIEYTDHYFRNLYVLAKLEKPLINIYEEIKHRLDYVTDEFYTPHLSLYYGKLDCKKQQALKEELELHIPKVFDCKRLDLYCTTNHVSEWHLINTFSLK